VSAGLPAGDEARLLTGEEGSVTLWLLGLVVALLFLGGISTDLWRAVTERRDLAGTVDAAAAAAASAIDERAFRDDGTVALDVRGATLIACDHLRRHHEQAETCAGIVVSPDVVEVTASRSVELSLLRILLPTEPPIEVAVTARAEPRRVP
jgi:Flp pilus assembly protein TadG